MADGLGVVVWLLAGTWWGHGITGGGETMALTGEWRSLARRGLLGDYPAHEQQWPMWVPGGPADATIGANLEHLGARWRPHAICLTHARFRHPAAIAALFESGPGWPSPPPAADWERVVAGLDGITPAQFAELSARHDLIGTLDQLARRGGPGGDATPFSSWFAQRGTRLRTAVTQLLATARRAGGDRLIAGSNAIGPHAAALSGQHYGDLARQTDFIQPLLDT